MVTARWFTKARRNLYLGLIDLMAHEIRVIITTDAYVPDQGAHEFPADVTNEAAGPGYVAGGEVLAGKSLTINGANQVVFDCDDVTWTPSAFTGRTAVFLDVTAGLLLGYMENSADVTSTGGEWKITIPAEGLLQDTPL